MRRSLFHRFAKNESAAIAPMYALGIGTLVVMSAVGFDYGRLMALDTELQNAADQAALAAATQLDGTDSAMINARNAANTRFATAASQFVNQTRFANDARVTGATDSRPITNLSYRFFNGYTNDAMGTLLTNDNQGATAKVVEVTVNARRVFFALTPLVGAFTSGDVIGRALAGLESATCNVPPMMFCVPNDSAGNPITTFPTDADIGKGMKLHFKVQGNSNGNGVNTTDNAVWAPGNFGFLDIYNINGNTRVRTLGLNSDFLGCTGNVIESDPGFRDPQGDALNSRFDFYSGSVNQNACDTGTGDFCPAASARKDYTVTEIKEIRVRPIDPAPAAPECGDYDTRGNYTADTRANNFKQDNCFVDGTCAVFGSAPASASSPNWDASTYMAAHHPSTPLSTAAPNGTRYEVYRWEQLDPTNRLRPERVASSYTAAPQGNGQNSRMVYTFTNVCSYPQPIINPPGISSSSTQKDRRLLTVAAVNCTGLNGKAPVNILRWVDLFLLEPSNTSSNDKNFFTEIVGVARRANGESGFQYFGRQKAVLIR